MQCDVLVDTREINGKDRIVYNKSSSSSRNSIQNQLNSRKYFKGISHGNLAEFLIKLDQLLILKSTVWVY